MFRTIQQRITISFTLVVVLVMTGLGIFLANYVHDIQIDSMRSSLEKQARIFGETIQPFFNGNTGDLNLEELVSSIGLETDERVTVIDASGKVLVDSEEDASVMENHASRPEFKAAFQGMVGQSTRYSVTLRIYMMYVAVPIVSGGEIPGAVRFSLPLTDVNKMTGEVITSIVIGVLISVGLVIFLAWLLSRLITSPIRELIEASQKISTGEMNQRINAGSLDETGKLARSFNTMSANLAEKIDTISQERTRLSGILDNIADGVIMTDRDGIVLTFNKAAETIFGIKNRNPVGLPLIEVIHDHEIGELLKNCLASETEEEIRFESDRYLRFLRVLAVPARQRTGGVLILVQDLTELRSMQTVRRELIGNISHDFRTPLAGIKAMVETLSGGALSDKEAALDFMSRIESEVDKLTQMVSELTELSRIETGRAELQKQDVNLNVLISESVNSLKPQAERKDISISVMPDEALPEIAVDQERIKQVLTNLLHNAIKFTGQNGEIVIKTRFDETGISAEITDNGIGIAAKDIPHIFERFYMADRSRTGGGTGIGLAIAKHVIEIHGGTINVKSREGTGSTFTIYLPR